jgi:arsenical pump membrane protein
MIAVTRHIPWRSLPVDAIAVAGGLALLAAATVDHLPLREVLGGEGPGAAVRTLAAGVLGANVMNNLPALLVGLPFVEPGALWSFLAGVNFGPILWIHGSLAGLLWLDIVRGHGLEITPISYARVSVRVGLPALLAVSVVIVGTAGVIAAS